MGSWFSNIHVRKSETVTAETVAAYINKLMGTRNGLIPASAEDADGAVAIVVDDAHPWISVYSDVLSFEDPAAYAEIAAPLSGELNTDVLGIACFDSDYLYLNLLNSGDTVNAWVGIGSAAGLGIKRRTGLTAWKKKVADFPNFSAAAKMKYLFAEEFLTEAERCLELPPERSSAAYEYLEDLGLQENAQIFYFRLPEDQRSKEPPVLVQRISSLMPCYLEQPHLVQAVNVGGESRGLSVYFIGPYVEHEEITFSGVWFVKWKGNETKQEPFELEKVQMSDGQWAYYYHDPGYRIPPKVDEGLPYKKQVDMIRDREIIVRFIPHGNPRKILDITVVIVPDKNPEGQTGWNVWYSHGSKEAFLDFHNESETRFWNRFPTERRQMKLLRREDFD